MVFVFWREELKIVYYYIMKCFKVTRITIYESSEKSPKREFLFLFWSVKTFCEQENTRHFY